MSVFKPYRSLLRLATAAMLGLLLARNGITRRTLGTAMCSLLLMLSEDALSVINRHGSVRMLLQRAGLLRRSVESADPPALVKWELNVQGMRCQACAAHIRGTVSALPGIKNATVQLQEGRVDVWAYGSSDAVTGDKLVSIIGSLDPTYAVIVARHSCYAKDERQVGCGKQAQPTPAVEVAQEPQLLQSEGKADSSEL